ncbi:MAG: hypothetical protein AAB553_07375, partial [Patescibacteria group bacterium]
MFIDAAPYLSNPLVLIGFSLFVLVGLFTTVVKLGIGPHLTKKARKEIVNQVLRYGFIVSVLVILSGFASNVLVTQQPSIKAVEAPLIPTTDLIPFHFGWVFIGYFNFESETYVDGNYLRQVYRPDTTKKDQKTPVLGDIYQITK